MSDLEQALRRRAETGPGRGPHVIYEAARAEAGRHRQRPRNRAIAAAALLTFVVLIAGVTVLARSSSTRSVHPAVDTPTTTEVEGDPIDESTPFLWLTESVEYLGRGSGQPQVVDDRGTRCCGVATINALAAYIGGGGTIRVIEPNGTVHDTDVAADRLIADRNAAWFYAKQLRRLVVVQTTGALAPGGHFTAGSSWTIPDGWDLANDGVGVDAVGRRVILERVDQTRAEHEIAVWTPETGDLKPIGTANWVIDATGYGRAMVAWTSTDCTARGAGCDLNITDLDTMATDTIRTPPDTYGFIGGGKFSFDGTQLAVFTADNEMAIDPAAHLAIVDVADQSVRTFDDTGVPIGEPYGAAAWTLDGKAVVYLGLDPASLLDLDTGTVRQLPWNINYSITAMP